jgi:YVTN family beta-propeller protein
MTGFAVSRKFVAVVVVALSGSGILVATSATPGAAAAGGCAGTAYVTNALDGTVSVISTATGAVSPPITVGNMPNQVAITPDGKRAYVTNTMTATNTMDGTVSVITTATGAVSPPITVGRYPEGVAICRTLSAHQRR